MLPGLTVANRDWLPLAKKNQCYKSMNNILLLLLVVVAGLTPSCSKTNSNLIGRWKLVETLADPGDGSGTFRRVSSNKTLEFHSDGKLTSNGEICSISNETGSPSTGRFSLADSTIVGDNCRDLYRKITFEKHGKILILNFPCIEPCRAKFKKE